MSNKENIFCNVQEATPKKKRNRFLKVSFSGGETSAYMAQWIKKNLEHLYEEVIYVFANTGDENEETYEFIKECDEYFKLNIHWIESVIHPEKGKGPTYKTTDYLTASRNGEPFKAMTKKYGIQSQIFHGCSGYLKQTPIDKYAKDYFNGEPHDTAVGIRADEIRRVSKNEKNFIYPLVHMKPTTKAQINTYWREMPFRLNLKSWETNCKVCFHKSIDKLRLIAYETPEKFKVFKEIEEKYSHVKAGKKPKLIYSKKSTDTLTVQNIIDSAANIDIKNMHEVYDENLELFHCDPYLGCNETDAAEL
jgi:hypothetical protein